MLRWVQLTRVASSLITPETYDRGADHCETNTISTGVNGIRTHNRICSTALYPLRRQIALFLRFRCSIYDDAHMSNVRHVRRQLHIYTLTYAHPRTHTVISYRVFRRALYSRHPSSMHQVKFLLAHSRRKVGFKFDSGSMLHKLLLWCVSIYASVSVCMCVLGRGGMVCLFIGMVT